MDAKSVAFLLLVSVATSHAQPPKELCCFPDEYVINYVSQTGISRFGVPNAFTVYATSAFDFTNERIGEDGVLIIAGEPPRDYKIIQDYKNEVKYTIDRGASTCDKTKLKGQIIHCVAAGYSFNDTAYLGDKAMYTDSYFYLKSKTQYGVSVSKENCIPVSFNLRRKSGFTSLLTFTEFYNYVSGISDPGDFFTVPDYCPSDITGESELFKKLKYNRLPY